jgi:hypothetical protein
LRRAGVGERQRKADVPAMQAERQDRGLAVIARKELVRAAPFH